MASRALRAWFATLALACALPLPAQSPTPAPAPASVHDAAHTERRVAALSEQLRCLVCQNQSIAESSAPLAVDLKNRVREQVQLGHSDEQIRRYMVERYGEFVLYKPPLKLATLLLWLGPFVLLLAVAAFLARRLFVAPADADGAVPPDQLQRAASLLESEPSGGER